MRTDWEFRTLGSVCRSIQDGSHRSPQAQSNSPGEGLFPYITSKNIRNNHLDLSSISYVDRKFHDEIYSRCTPELGDVLLTKDGANTGNVTLNTISEPFSLLSSVCLIKTRPEILHPGFLSYYIQSPAGLKSITGQMTGTAIKRIILRDIRIAKVPTPPLPEQHRIVGILDEAFSVIATSKAHAEKNLQNARAVFESHLDAVFTQRGEGWAEKKLGDVCDFVGGSQPPKSVFSQIKSPGYVRLIQIRDYKSDKHAVYIPRSLARRFCEINDVMIGRYGPPLFQILRGIEGAYNVALMKAVPDETQLSRDFLFYFLKHPSILRYVIYHSERAAGQIGLTKATIEPYPIAVPPLRTQAEVTQQINNLSDNVERLESIYQQKLFALDDLKKSLLHHAFSGEL